MPVPARDATIELVVGGDAMLGRLVNERIRRDGPRRPLEAIADITQSADLFFANLECAISDRDHRYSGPPKMFYFRADLAAIEALTYAGIDAVSLANNHALDADESGLRDTLRALEAAGIAQAGAGSDAAAAAQPARLQVGETTVGLLSWCDHQEDFAATSERGGFRYVDVRQPAMVEALESDVARLADEVDLVIVACHWQSNWAPVVEEPYRRLGRRLVKAGADVVWGHSPHHFQGVEWIGERVILYSTGGVVDDYRVDPDYRNDLQLLFRLHLHRGGGVDAVETLPIKLELARTSPAASDERAWIVERFRQFCSQVGSTMTDDDTWLAVRRAEP